MDIQKYVRPVDFRDLSNDYRGVTSESLRQRAEAAQSIQELEARTGIKQVQLLERLSMLELEGLVTLSASGVDRWCG